MPLNPNALTDLAAVKGELDIPNASQDTYLERLINVASRQIERHCNRVLVSTAHTMTFDGTNANVIVLPQYPVTTLTGVWIDAARVFGSGTAVESTNLCDEPEDLGAGLLRLVSGCWPKGVRNVKVQYTAGYIDIPADAPDLEQACIYLVELMYRTRSDKRLGRSSITRGEESVDYLTQWPNELLTLLAPYVRERFDPGSLTRVQ